MIFQDILDSLVFDEEPTIYTDKYADNYAVDIVETALHLMDEFIILNPNIISDEHFQEILFEEIQHIFLIQFEDQINNLYNGDQFEDELNELLEDAFNIFIDTFFKTNQTIEVKTYDKIQIIEQKIQKLREIPQPIQGTQEWLDFRWNLLTAYNIWKALGTQSSINQLIYEKCLPVKNNNSVNINSPLHWGKKYEPVTLLIYENIFKTKVEEFGCIQHQNYSFLAASPDGIIVNHESERFGRLLEIKNVVSREINGIPKKEYWIQMQTQMEVCDLDECDFVETKFIEYPDENTFLQDKQPDTTNLCLSEDSKYKGQILFFIQNNGTTIYIYKPLNIVLFEEINNWQNTTINTYENQPYNYTFIKIIYWKLDVFSCQLFLRNKEWFQNNIIQIENVWNIIQTERISGYQHRAPIQKNKKDKNTLNQSPPECLIFDTIIKLNECE